MPEWKQFQAQLGGFKRRRPVYQAAADYLQQHFKTLCGKIGVYPLTGGRAKSLESFAEKIQRPGKSYTDPINELTDLCGVRVIVHTTSDVTRVREAFEAQVDPLGIAIDWGNSLDARDRLDVKAFGYLSQHLILELVDRAFVPDALRDISREIGSLKVELQLRTLAQHAWADYFHEAGYKNEFKIPPLLERDFARVAALLEQCDNVFSAIGEKVDELGRPGYEAYIDEKILEKTAKRLEIYCLIDPGNAAVLSRLMRIYKSLQRWAEMIDLYREHEGLLSSEAAVVRDVGVAHHNLAKKEEDPARKAAMLDTAAEHLREALRLDPLDVDARCALGGSYRTRGDAGKARDQYLEALQVDPSNPYALGNYIVLEAREQGNLEHLRPLQAALRDGLRRCREQISVGVNLPWARFDEGLFLLCLDEVSAALETYGEMLRTGQGPQKWQVDTHLRALDDLRALALPGYDAVIEMLRPYAS